MATVVGQDERDGDKKGTYVVIIGAKDSSHDLFTPAQTKERYYYCSDPDYKKRTPPAQL